MSKKSLITISFLVLLSSFSVYAEEGNIDDSYEYKVGNWIPCNVEGQPTDHLSQTTMWKLLGENIWISAVRDRNVYNETERYVKWSTANDACENAEYSGFDDWRLPTIEELEHFVNKDISFIDRLQGIEDISTYFVWSSSKGKREKERYVMLGVELFNKDTEREDLAAGLYFCVRSGNINKE